MLTDGMSYVSNAGTFAKGVKACFTLPDTLPDELGDLTVLLLSLLYSPFEMDP